MRQNVTTLSDFYASPLGRVAARLMAEKLASLWPEAGGLNMLGFGYATPLLEGRCGGARRAIAVMPGEQGACWWGPAGRGASVALTDEDHLPFADGMFDRIIVLHGLEEAASPRAMLRELWRIMAPEGRIVVAAANRNGLWARADRTPFGHGRPWSRRQLSALLSDTLFQTTAWTYALHVPPLTLRMVTATADIWERAGERILTGMGGVVMVEAVKRLYIEPHDTVSAPALTAKKTRPLTSRRRKS